MTEHLTAKGDTIRYDYDVLNGLAEKTYENQNGAETGHPVRMGYNVMGQRISMEDMIVDRDSRETFYSYDPLNRLTRVKRADGSTSSYTYNACDQIVEAENLCSCGFLISSYKYTYDDAGLFEEYRGDGTLEQGMQREHETIQYLKWLSATYGKTGMEKAGAWLATEEGRHTALDGAGIFLEPADAVNALLYLLEGDRGNAVLSGISIIPMLGDYLGKGGKGVLKAADLAKLKRYRKVARVLDSLELFIKVPREELEEARKWIRKSWDNVVDGMQTREMATVEGLTFWVRPGDNFRANIHLMDDAGDVFQDTFAGWTEGWRWAG